MTTGGVTLDALAFAPSRGRELKLAHLAQMIHAAMFAPSRGRELK